jgi:P27 family predicted phage terminase small subunit
MQKVIKSAHLLGRNGFRAHALSGSCWPTTILEDDVGKRGPAPAPAGLKLVNGVSEGRDSGGRKVPRPPAFERCAPQPPPWLPVLAREMWEHTVPELEGLNLLKNADLAVLTSYCVAWDQLARAVPLYTELGGMLIANKRSGVVKPNPAVALARAAIRDLLLTARELGCTPSAEAALGTLMSGVVGGVDGEANPFDWTARKA